MTNEKIFHLESTCHTEGCENENIVIESTTTDENIIVICGPCGTQLEDVVFITDKV